jgi:integrase
MATVTFVLKNPQDGLKPREQTETLIYLILRYSNKRVKLSIGEKILPKYWNKENQEALTNPLFSKYDFNQKLLNKKKLILDIYRRMVNDGEQPDNKKLLDEFSVRDNDRRFNNTKPTENVNLNQYIVQFINDIKSGARLTPDKKEKYKSTTVKSFVGFKSQFDRFQQLNRKVLEFNDINVDFYDDFLGFFTDKSNSPNYIGRNIKNLKTIMRAARDEGLHNNSEIDRKKFKVIRVETDQIYLNQKEIDDLYELNLSDKPLLDAARDVFLVGCYTAQRFSDYSRINKSNIRTLVNGAKIIELIQGKTGEKVIIPMHWRLEKILEKYDYVLPKTYEQKVNERIKVVGELACINKMVTIEQVKGGLKIKKEIPKYELIKTHTARRSGASNMYLAGIPTLIIMKLTGHRTEREFLKYIRVSKEETAELLANHEYFKNKMKVV